MGSLGDVVVRVKRRRDEGGAPPVLLLPHKRRRQDELAKAFGNLSVAEKGADSATGETAGRAVLVCELVQGQGRKRKLDAETEQEHEQGQESTEAEEGEMILPKIKRAKVVQLEMNQGSLKAGRKTADSDVNEQLDFLIWHTMQTGDSTMLRSVLKLDQPLDSDSNGCVDVNFQRPIDGVTALMAASSHCDNEVIEALLKRGADPCLEDASGFTAMDRVGFNLDKPPPQVLEYTLNLLQQSEYVYDTYFVKDQMELDSNNQTSSSNQSLEGVWTSNGLKTAWSDAPVADFEVDLQEWGITQFDYTDGERESVNDSDYDNEDDENYRYNDYPDEEEEGFSDEEGEQEEEAFGKRCLSNSDCEEDIDSEFGCSDAY